MGCDIHMFAEKINGRTGKWRKVGKMFPYPYYNKDQESKLKEKYSLEDKNISFLGDDTQDVEILKKVGLSCCPKNAQKAIKEISLYRSPFKGGKGFVRDVCNLILD